MQCHNISHHTAPTLCNKDIQSLVSFNWNLMVQQIATVSPDLIDILVTAAVQLERERANKIKTGDRRIPPLALALAVILQSSVCNSVQRILSLLMVDGACSKRTFERFNHLGLCLSPTGTHKMLDGLGSFQTAEIVKQIRDEHSFRVVGDNFDLLIKVRQMLLDNRNKSHHWFNLLLVLSRMSSSHLPNDGPICHCKTSQ